MINLSDYEFIERPKSELAADNIINDIYRKFWDEHGYMSIYYLGAISQLKSIVKHMKDTTSLTKHDLLTIIAGMKNYPEAPDNIKSLIDTILEEFDYEDE